MSTTKSTTTAATAPRSVEATELDPKKIHPHPLNKRQDATPDEGLVASVRSHGVLERLILAPVPADLPEAARKQLKRGTEFLLIAGHRRRGAAVAAKVKSVPVDIRHDLDTTEAQLGVIAAENIHRRDLSPLEEGDIYLELQGLGLNQGQVHDRTGVPKPRISERSRVAKLPGTAREKFAAGQLTMDVALVLARVEDEAELERIMKQPSYVWQQEARRVVEAREAAKRTAAERTRLEKAGITVLTEYPPLPDEPADEVTDAEWWQLADLVSIAESADQERFFRVVAAHRDVDVAAADDLAAFIESIAMDDIDTWHEQTCKGHALVEVQHRGTSWAPAHTQWVPICTTMSAHADLVRDESGDALADTVAARRPGDPQAPQEERKEDPETAARRAHLEKRVEQHTAWLGVLLREGDATALQVRAWSQARAQVSRVDLDENGNPQGWQSGKIEGRRKILDLPEGTSAEDIEDAFATFADGLDLPALLLLNEVAEHGPAYGDEQMRHPGGFGNGWAVDRVEMLNDLGWQWDDQELEEIRRHPRLVKSLGLDAPVEVDGTDEAGAA